MHPWVYKKSVTKMKCMCSKGTLGLKYNLKISFKDYILEARVDISCFTMHIFFLYFVILHNFFQIEVKNSYLYLCIKNEKNLIPYSFYLFSYFFYRCHCFGLYS